MLDQRASILDLASSIRDNFARSNPEAGEPVVLRSPSPASSSGRMPHTANRLDLKRRPDAKQLESSEGDDADICVGFLRWQINPQSVFGLHKLQGLSGGEQMRGEDLGIDTVQLQG
jgi:hypothetical protein